MCVLVQSSAEGFAVFIFRMERRFENCLCPLVVLFSGALDEISLADMRSKVNMNTYAAYNVHCICGRSIRLAYVGCFLFHANIR